MIASIITKGEIGECTDGVGDIGTNELLDALNWFIHELRLCTKDWSTTGFPSLSSL